MNEVASFVKKPANAKEVIILDFQAIQIKYDDQRAIDVLLGLVQKKLGPYIAPVDQVNKWQEKSLTDFLSQGRQIIVLVPSAISERVTKPGFKPGCAAKFDGKNFTLLSKKTACLAVEVCGTSNEMLKPQLKTNVAACTPGGGCC